jgi:hypothetical protein
MSLKKKAHQNAVSDCETTAGCYYISRQMVECRRYPGDCGERWYWFYIRPGGHLSACTVQVSWWQMCSSKSELQQISWTWFLCGKIDAITFGPGLLVLLWREAIYVGCEGWQVLSYHICNKSIKYGWGCGRLLHQLCRHMRYMQDTEVTQLQLMNSGT